MMSCCSCATSGAADGWLGQTILSAPGGPPALAPSAWPSPSVLPENTLTISRLRTVPPRPYGTRVHFPVVASHRATVLPEIWSEEGVLRPRSN
jgi:hypothetical protein